MRLRKYRLLFLFLSFVIFVEALIPCTSLETEKAAPRVLLLAPAFPWNFGPYQNQQALLGVELTRRANDNIFLGK